MVYRVYIDVIFAVNLFMDLAVLAMLNRLFSYRADLKHMIRGAVLGAVWACVLAVFPETPLLLQMFGTYVAVGSLMAVTAYGIRSRKELIRAVGGIYLISVVLGGVMLALSESSLGREVANWMPGRFSIRFFLAFSYRDQIPEYRIFLRIDVYSMIGSFSNSLEHSAAIIVRIPLQVSSKSCSPLRSAKGL